MTVVSKSRGRWLLPAAALLFLAPVFPAAAQNPTPKAPPPVGGIGGGAGGVGGGAGLIPTFPEVRSMSPVPQAAPQVVPVVPAPAAPAVVVPAAPAMPAPIIRFRCEVPSGQETCKDPAPDAGGEDTCDCAKDLCYKEPSGTRICEKP
jgi:hypothetical protein